MSPKRLSLFERLNQGKVHSSLAQKMGNSPINIELGLLQWGDDLRALQGLLWRSFRKRNIELVENIQK
jgi:hypothetical protein